MIIPSFTNFVFLFMTVSAFGMCCGYSTLCNWRKSRYMDTRISYVIDLYSIHTEGNIR